MQLLIDYLSCKFPGAKRQTLKRMVEAGRVTINDRVASKLRQPLEAGDKVHVRDTRPQEPPAPLPASLRIIYEDDDLLVVDKPAGLLTSTAVSERRPTLIALVRQYLAACDHQARAGVVHRLDRDAAGLLVFSKNHAAYRHLKQQFFRHDVQRIYLAVVEGRPATPQGRINSFLVEITDGSVHSTRLRGKGQHAVTEYEVIGQGNGRSLLRVRLLTGRKHQIRVHLSEAQTPIVGDRVYGSGQSGQNLLLVATRLELVHPRSGNKMVFELPPPPEMQRALQ